MISLLFAFSLSASLNADEKLFRTWMKNTNQLFLGEDYQYRLNIWLTNKKFVEQHNAAHKFKVTLNKYAALTPNEYRSKLLHYSVHPQFTYSKTTHRSVKYPESLDWREIGAVTPVRDAEAYSSAGVEAIEGSYVVNFGNTLEAFSLQEIIDCSLMINDFQYVLLKDGKMCLDKDYPYTGKKGTCQRDDSKAVGNFNLYLTVIEGDEDDLAKKVSEKGPIKVLVDGSQASFQLYMSGIYEERQCDPNDLNTDLCVVGYGSEGDEKYWICKNHWSTAWGEEGYIRMIWLNNQCGIASQGSGIH